MRNLPRYGLLAASLLLAACNSPKPAAPAAQAEPPAADYLHESREAFDARMAWWREARFGMFIHWGPYAVAGGYHDGKAVPGIGEWIMHHAAIPVEAYETQYSRNFNPTKYDPDEWARIAKDAGMKYIVITSKHHDGFALWNSEVSGYDAVDFAPIATDLLQPLKAACDREGIRFSVYHSIMDWHHPDAQAPFFPNYNDTERSNPQFPRYVEQYLKPQLRELITRYQPAILWFDGEWIGDWTHEQGQDMYQYVRSLKPDILINNRVDKGRQGMQGMNKDDQQYFGDFGTPEQEILPGMSTLDWESCMTMNDTWGFKRDDVNWKSAETLIHNLVDIVSKGGNYLLNVGPTPEGEIPAASVERLAEMGEWMRVNSEAIYGGGAWETFGEGDKVRYIRSRDGQHVYAVSLGWPGKQLKLSAVKPAEGAQVSLLGEDGPVSWDYAKNQLVLTMPPDLARDASKRPCKYAFVFKIPVQKP
ncbi:MAG: alpha-L-fucosidase [Bacteroidia bacterium]|nr:alpha-L-fucosidase [Bacteroidia bacterium]